MLCLFAQHELGGDDRFLYLEVLQHFWMHLAEDRRGSVLGHSPGAPARYKYWVIVLFYLEIAA